MTKKCRERDRKGKHIRPGWKSISPHVSHWLSSLVCSRRSAEHPRPKLAAWGSSVHQQRQPWCENDLSNDSWFFWMPALQQALKLFFPVMSALLLSEFLEGPLLNLALSFLDTSFSLMSHVFLIFSLEAIHGVLDCASANLVQVREHNSASDLSCCVGCVDVLKVKS